MAKRNQKPIDNNISVKSSPRNRITKVINVKPISNEKEFVKNIAVKSSREKKVLNIPLDLEAKVLSKTFFLERSQKQLKKKEIFFYTFKIFF